MVSERSFSQERHRLVVAHRGASAVAPENTLSAFELAIDVAADAVEFDVRMTSDDQAVVLHDPDVSRTTDGRGLVRDLTLRELRRLRTHEGGQVPTLAEVLDHCSGRIAVDVEIKNVPGEPDFEPDRELAVEATLRALDASAFSGPVLLSSFNPFSIAAARSLVPDMPTGLLVDPSVEAEVGLRYAAEEGHPWVLLSVASALAAGPELSTLARDLGVRVAAWVTDDPAVASALWDAGVEAVATNDPAVLTAARRRGPPP